MNPFHSSQVVNTSEVTAPVLPDRRLVESQGSFLEPRVLGRMGIDGESQARTVGFLEISQDFFMDL